MWEHLAATIIAVMIELERFAGETERRAEEKGTCSTTHVPLFLFHKHEGELGGEVLPFPLDIFQARCLRLGSSVSCHMCVCVCVWRAPSDTYDEGLSFSRQQGEKVSSV